MRRRLSLGLAGTIALSIALAAQTQMPNPKEISGLPLPTTEVPAGTVTVRVIIGNFDKNVPDQPVSVFVDGRKRVVTTDSTGRARVDGLAPGAKVRATTVVKGESIESKEATIGSSGIRFVLVATDPEIERRADEDRKLAAGPAVKGAVVFGPESRVIAEMTDDRLRIFYVMEILNTARTPVDVGGPLIIDLPTGARGATILEGSSNQATANGPRITVTGPFAPGTTLVQTGFELPYKGDTARLEQRWPAALSQVTVLMPQTGVLTLESPQVTARREVTDQQQLVVVGTGPGLAAGQALSLAIGGLPHHPVWPRVVALSLAGLIMAVGIWAAVFNTPRRA